MLFNWIPIVRSGLSRRLMFLLVALLLAACSPTGRGFDPEAWRQAAPIGCRPDNPRSTMTSDLEQILQRDRPTKEEVRTLLGPPDIEESITMSYMIGNVVIDCDMLTIIFGADNRVQEVRYVQG